ncbi:hypothetical protein FRB94_004462 [Tulasnella sp. JGI-2019a]|nr:hypothetical protein FRB93_005364 [Tulasnella sp. JGI-2019a]KAG9001866.1 hypothetical protein FRB94_004462 [Tulasnella sp. JGI-2019a]
MSQSQLQSPPHYQQPPPPLLQLPQKMSNLSMLLNDFKPPRKTPRLGLAELLSPAPSNAKLAPPAQSSSTSNGAGAVPNNNAKPSSSSSNSSQPHLCMSPSPPTLLIPATLASPLHPLHILQHAYMQ